MSLIMKRKNQRGMAMVMAIAGIATFLGLIFGWYVSSQSHREFSVSERDRKLLSQVAVTSSESVKTKLVNYLQTLTNAYNPNSPQSISTVTAAQLGYSSKPSETIQIQCIGQGSLNLAQNGGALGTCTNSNAVYPKIFSISVNARSDNGGVVASLLETVEVGPASFNDVGYFISGESSSLDINFAGGVYEGMVAAFFENPQINNSIGLINPPGTPLVFNGVVMSNLSKDRIFKGVPLSNGSRSAVGEVQFNKGFLSLSQPTLGIELGQFRSSNNFTIIDPPALSNGTLAEKVIVELGGLNDADRCKVRITEERSPTCAALSEAVISTHCPNFISADAKSVTYDSVIKEPISLSTAQASLVSHIEPIADEDGLSTSNVAPTEHLDTAEVASTLACTTSLMNDLGQKTQFNGKYFETWNGKDWEEVSQDLVTKLCTLDLRDIETNRTLSTEACAEEIKRTYKTEVGFDKFGRMMACSPTRATATYPSSMPVDVVSNAVYVIQGREVEFRPINNSGDFMTICENATFFVERSSSVKLRTSILRTRPGGGVDWKAETFKPTEPKANMAIIAQQGDISLMTDTRSTEQSMTLATLKGGSPPANKKTLVVEASLLAPEGSPLLVPQSLRDPNTSGTMGALEVYGSLMGKNQVLTRSVNYLGNTPSISGFSYVNLIYNKTNLISPAPIMGENISGLALQSTTTSFQLDFANVNEAMAYVNDGEQN